MKKSQVFLLHSLFLASFFLFSSLHSVEEDSEIPEINSSKKKVELWRGEVTGIYKNRASVKIKISRNQKTSQWKEKDWNQFFSENKEFSVFQKDTNLEIGKFRVQELLLLDATLAKRQKSIEAILRGDFLPISKTTKRQEEITIDCYISAFTEKDFYLEPGNFFKGRFTPPKTSIFHPKDRKEMVLVSRGLLLYGQGTDPSQDSFNPFFQNIKLSTVPEIKSFYIDKYEVTNQEYATFLEKTNRKAPPHWLGGKFPEGEDHHPVHSLTYREVEAYAEWTGKRLPTEWEWERAAKGSGVNSFTNRDETVSFESNNQRYPFGDEFDPLYCNSRESKIGKTVSVYELPEESASPFGALGMCGNAPEWTSSWYEPYPGHYVRSFAMGKQFKVIRGGSYADSAKQATVYYRNYGGIPNLSEDRKAGFRLVMDYKE